MIKALYDFMIRSLSSYITILASLGAIDTHGFTLSHDLARLRGQRVMFLYREKLIKVSYNSPNFAAIGILVVDI